MYLDTKEIGAKAEIALMGRHVFINTNDEAQHIVQYILDTFNKHTDAQEVLKDALKYSKDKMTIAYVGTSTILGHMKVINIVLKTKTAKNYPNMTEKNRNGVLAYCYNMDAVDCSELGYMFFKTDASGIRRIA